MEDERAVLERYYNCMFVARFLDQLKSWSNEAQVWGQTVMGLGTAFKVFYMRDMCEEFFRSWALANPLSRFSKAKKEHGQVVYTFESLKDLWGHLSAAGVYDQMVVKVGGTSNSWLLPLTVQFTCSNFTLKKYLDDYQEIYQAQGWNAYIFDASFRYNSLLELKQKDADGKYSAATRVTSSLLVISLKHGVKVNSKRFQGKVEFSLVVFPDHNGKLVTLHPDIWEVSDNVPSVFGYNKTYIPTQFLAFANHMNMPTLVEYQDRLKLGKCLKFQWEALHLHEGNLVFGDPKDHLTSNFLFGQAPSVSSGNDEGDVSGDDQGDVAPSSGNDGDLSGDDEGDVAPSSAAAAQAAAPAARHPSWPPPLPGHRAVELTEVQGSIRRMLRRDEALVGYTIAFSFKDNSRGPEEVGLYHKAFLRSNILHARGQYDVTWEDDQADGKVVLKEENYRTTLAPEESNIDGLWCLHTQSLFDSPAFLRSVPTPQPYPRKISTNAAGEVQPQKKKTKRTREQHASPVVFAIQHTRSTRAAKRADSTIDLAGPFVNKPGRKI